ncbi:hypothetical protein AAE478_002957 [Parahypoxylon ruwenzoriense]
MSETGSRTPPHHSALKATCGQAQLLAGTCHYACGHKFSWILDYFLERTGHRSPSSHGCPRCVADPTCLICLERFDAKTTDACSSCDNFFSESLLVERRIKLENLNIKVAEHKATTFIKSRLDFEKDRLRQKYGNNS